MSRFSWRFVLRLIRRLHEDTKNIHDPVCLDDVIVDAKITDPEPILAPKRLCHCFDAAFTDKRRLVKKMQLDAVQDSTTIKEPHCMEVVDRFHGVSDLVSLTLHCILGNPI
jgi:hypothetical protein